MQDFEFAYSAQLNVLVLRAMGRQEWRRCIERGVPQLQSETSLFEILQLGRDWGNLLPEEANADATQALHRITRRLFQPNKVR